MSKVTFFCLFFMSILGTSIYANDLNDRNILAKEAQEKAFLKSIEFVEIDYEMEACTKLLRYLPEDFNPFEGMIIDMSEIAFEKVAETVTLGFDTFKYLPKDFNPYKGQ